MVPSPLAVVLTPGQRINSLALMGLVATGAVITGVSGATTVYSRTVDLNTREVLDWYDYYFAPFGNQPSVVLFDIPAYSDLVLTITLTNAGGNVQCGACVVGTFEYIGSVQSEAESDALNFSTVSRDFAGNTAVMVQRRNVPRTVQSIVIDDALFERYLKSTDFIQQYIFPGGCLPCPREFRRQAQAAGLRVVDELAFGLDYAETLRRWLPDIGQPAHGIDLVDRPHMHLDARAMRRLQQPAAQHADRALPLGDLQGVEAREQARGAAARLAGRRAEVWAAI